MSSAEYQNQYYLKNRAKRLAQGDAARRRRRAADGRPILARGAAGITHGHNAGKKKTPTLQTWASMRARCTNPKKSDYQYYGGRGITVCDRWQSFENFLADMGEKPPGTSLDRIDNSGNYEPSNCRWATRAEQMRNTRQTRMLTLNGKTQCVVDWERELGFKPVTITMRLRRGWSVEKALTMPLRVQPQVTETREG